MPFKAIAIFVPIRFPGYLRKLGVSTNVQKTPVHPAAFTLSSLARPPLTTRMNIRIP